MSEYSSISNNDDDPSQMGMNDQISKVNISQISLNDEISKNNISQMSMNDQISKVNISQISLNDEISKDNIGQNREMSMINSMGDQSSISLLNRKRKQNRSQQNENRILPLELVEQMNVLEEQFYMNLDINNFMTDKFIENKPVLQKTKKQTQKEKKVKKRQQNCFKKMKKNKENDEDNHKFAKKPIDKQHQLEVQKYELQILNSKIHDDSELIFQSSQQFEDEEFENDDNIEQSSEDEDKMEQLFGGKNKNVNLLIQNVSEQNKKELNAKKIKKQKKNSTKSTISSFWAINSKRIDYLQQLFKIDQEKLKNILLSNLQQNTFPIKQFWSSNFGIEFIKNKFHYYLRIEKFNLPAKQFFGQGWSSLVFLSLKNCSIDDQGWKFLNYGPQTDLRNLKILFLNKNKITTIQYSQLHRWDHLKFIDFGITYEDKNPFTQETVQDLKKNLYNPEELTRLLTISEDNRRKFKKQKIVWFKQALDQQKSYPFKKIMKKNK